MTQPEPNPAAARAGWRVLLAFAWVCVIASWPARLWPWQALPAMALAALTFRMRMPVGPVLRRALLVWLLAGFMSLGWIGQPEGLLRVGNLLLKSTLSLWTLSLLFHALSAPNVVAGLRWLGLPGRLTETLAFWGRYYAVLTAEWQRLQLARRARMFTRDRRLKFRLLTNMLGLLFIRAYERAEKVHRAMLARGYRG